MKLAFKLPFQQHQEPDLTMFDANAEELSAYIEAQAKNTPQKGALPDIYYYIVKAEHAE